MNEREQVTQLAKGIYSDLVRMYEAVGEEGQADWFCKNYPFHMDLFEFIAEVGAWCESLEGGTFEEPYTEPCDECGALMTSVDNGAGWVHENTAEAHKCYTAFRWGVK